MKPVLLTIVLASLADALLTLAHLESGLAYEANPLMAVLIDTSGVLFVAVKVALTGAAALALWHWRGYALARGGATFALGVYALLLVWHARVMLA